MCSAQLLISTAAGGLKALMEDLVISPEFRRQGIGTKLLVALEAWAFAQGAQRLDLLADQRNQPALDYYQKNQWQLTNLICFQKKSY
jgi:ribosomal protein S18 acetylase RimI-like enzyme